jgi:hypothetical protein
MYYILFTDRTKCTILSVVVATSETVGAMGASEGAGIGAATLVIPSTTALSSWARSIKST